MNILLTGASGFLGQAIHKTLTAQGHTIVRAVRTPRDPSDIAVNFEADTQAATWLPRLKNIDAVVNAVGILGGSEAQMMAVHGAAPTALAQAAKQAGLQRFVQISALGVGGELQTRYFRSKLAGEQGVRAALPQAQIVRPSLVFGHGGASSEMFMKLTHLPLLMLPLAGRMTVQPVHAADVATGVAALLADGAAPAQTLLAVGPQAMGMTDYLKSLAAQLNRRVPFKLQAVLPMPHFAAQWSAKLAALLPQHVWTPETLTMLVAGSAADAAPFAALLGRAPIAVESFVNHA